MKYLAVLLLCPFISFASDTALLKCRSIGDNQQRLACYDAITENAPEPVDDRAGQHSDSAPFKPQTEAEFGLERKAIAQQLDEIVSRIPGEFKGWRAKQKIELENGQIWQVSDGSEGVYRLENPTVKIERGALGSFFLRIEGANKAPKVKRIK